MLILVVMAIPVTFLTIVLVLFVLFHTVYLPCCGHDGYMKDGLVSCLKKFFCCCCVYATYCQPHRPSRSNADCATVAHFVQYATRCAGRAGNQRSRQVQRQVQKPFVNGTSPRSRCSWNHRQMVPDSHQMVGRHRRRRTQRKMGMRRWGALSLLPRQPGTHITRTRVLQGW